MNKDNDNQPFNLAVDIVNVTNCNLFLTGKAGTGKTTFLKYIKEHTSKNVVVVAPTGVAAINAGGVTMHSFFQLPFIPFDPRPSRIFNTTATVDRHALIQGIRFSKEKIEIINSLDLLIIDEVSMLRADMLDAIDQILRHFRHKRNIAFGGVQLLFIGDMFQLPPVVSDNEWELMKEYYESPFFFSANVVKENPPLHVELKKIYRQKEDQFIHLLNQIRNNKMEKVDFELLNKRYKATDVDLNDHGITLTTHNYMADKINAQELGKLTTSMHFYNGEIKGDFAEKTLPTDLQLSLKEGAQVMFLKNDSDPAKRYYNGKLATIKELKQDKITVVLAESEVELELEKEKWSNVKYSFNKETNSIDEEELGSFLQYPIRLAWAITIHKSQGLTFDKVVIDAGASFAAGQVYVALSRCRTLDGIVLLSKIQHSSLHSDERIQLFASRENSLNEIETIIEREKPIFAAQLLLRTFDLSKLIIELYQFNEITEGKKLPGKDMLKGTTVGLIEIAKKQQDFAEKFIKQLNQILLEIPNNNVLLIDRVVKAKVYFTQSLHNDILIPLTNMRTFLKGKPQVKQYLNALGEIEDYVWSRLRQIEHVAFGEFKFEIPNIFERKVQEKQVKSKVVKGESKLQTWEFYKSGMSIDEISVQRGMTISTIEGHLLDYIASGEIPITVVLKEEIFAKIKQIIIEHNNVKLSFIKEILNDQTTFSQIRAAVTLIQRDNQVLPS